MSVNNAASGAVSDRNSGPVSLINIFLLVVLVAQIAITTYMLWPRTATTASGAPILTGVTADMATALTITDTDGRAVSFVKEGDAWSLADSDGYPARAEKITETLDKLVAINTDRLVTQTAGSHDRLQVAENNFVRKVDITTSGGVQTLYLGSSAGASATHVRAANSDATYLTSDVATWELDTLATTWIDVTYFQVPKEQMTEVTLENANGTFTFVPTGGANGDEWTLADATADEAVAPANINTLLDRIATLNLHTVLGKSDSPDYGLNAPLATITVTASDTTTATTSAALTTTTLVVGAKDDATNTYYLKSSDSEFYVRMAGFTGDELVNKTRQDFMVQPTGEEASATPSPAETTAEPTVEASGVTTDTSDVDSSTVATPTVTVSDVTTDTAETDSSATPTTTVEASDVTTATNAAENESTAIDEPDATVTPPN